MEISIGRWILLWTTFYVIGNFHCHANPVTTEVSITTALPINVSEPTTSSPSRELEFLVTPQSTEAELGASVTLACKTTVAVTDCQWSWQPLPPTNLPSPNTDSQAKTLIYNDVSISNGTMSLPVRTFPGFGNDSNDCSVKFASAQFEQAGYWACAARRNPEETFKSTPSVKLAVIQAEEGPKITFETQKEVIEAQPESEVKLACQVSRAVRECRWMYHRLNESSFSENSHRRFAPADESHRDCGLTINKVEPEHEGYWACGARVGVVNGEFVQAKPLRLVISQVEFVQISRDVQVTVGENVLLRCLINKPVTRCEWSWRSTDSNNNHSVTRRFPPNGEAENDCSLRFKNVIYEEEGYWTCGVRLTLNGTLLEAQRTTLALLPSGKVNFTEIPESQSVAIGSDVRLGCMTNGRVDKCSWSWVPLVGGDAESLSREFPSAGDLGRDCSLKLTKITRREEGHWTCRVYSTSPNLVITSPPAKLTVYEEEDVQFSELSRDIQLSVGGTVNLRCVTTGPVEQCRWSLTPTLEGGGNTTVVVMQFAPDGPESRDCSVKLSHALAEQEGLWRCGAKPRGRSYYIEAPPARLTLIEPEKPGSLSSIPASIQTKNNQFVSTTPAATSAESSSDVVSTSTTANFATSQES